VKPRDDETIAEFLARKEAVDRQLILADVMRRERILPDDPEFAEKVSSYLTGEIDPSVARHDPVRYRGETEPVPDDVMVGLYGLHSPESNEDTVLEKTLGGRPIDLEIPSGSVTAFHTRNTPMVYGHEYRHKNYPDLKERQNRRIDLIAAQNPHDVDQSIRMFGGGVPSENLPEIARTIRAMALRRIPYGTEYDIIEETSGRDAEEVIEESAMSRFMDEVREYEDWNEDLPERNRKRLAGEPETIADIIRELLEKAGL